MGTAWILKVAKKSTNEIGKGNVMAISDSYVSCGVIELYDLSSNPEKILEELAKELYRDELADKQADGKTPKVLEGNAAIVIWSDVWGRYKRGNVLYNYIKRAFPNSNLIRTKKARNPNSGNKIAAFVWKIPHRKFSRWWIENFNPIIEQEKYQSLRSYCDSPWSGIAIY